MNYKLAKKLKDAGFPQDLDKKEIEGAFGNSLGYYYLGKYGKVYKPLLSELIEMCGENFGELRLSSLVFTEENRWKVTNKNFSADPLVCVLAEGKTPDEAVANLWLELNKNGAI